MKFEDLFDEVGGFGRFQVIVLLMLCSPRLFLPWNFLLHNFLSAVPPHHCQLTAQDLLNLTQEDRLLAAIPKEEGGSLSACKMYSTPQLYNSTETLRQHNQSMIVGCQNGWEYNQSQFTSTLATEWDLVCDNRSLNEAATTIFFVGVMLGALLFGYLSDKFGRRRMLLLALLCTALFGMLSSFSTSYLMFAVTRFLCGVGLTGMSIISIILTVEWTDMEHRTLVAVMSSLTWSVGNMFLALIAYLIRDWRWLLFTVTTPSLIAAAVCWWIPESARWLLANGKTEEAQVSLWKCAKMNKRRVCQPGLSIEALRKVIKTDKSDKQYSFWHLLKTPKMRKLTLCSGVVWLGVSFSYYAISFSIGGFGLDMYLTQFIFGAIEVPAKLISYVLLDRVGRRRCQGWYLIATGLLMTFTLFISKEQRILQLVFAILAKGCSEGAFTTAFLYTAELYPTVLRQTGLGYTSFMARLAASLTPMIKLLDVYWVALPPILFIIFSASSGGVAFLLPETSNVPLPETIDHIEHPRYLDAMNCERLAVTKNRFAAKTEIESEAENCEEESCLNNEESSDVK
ncbi:solute carrier family 22 member 7-like [Scyliorhinus torazame]|uniref:solute carrier family 22 member 7-like n=1 Tax=Scyliorhinus torazame TaxID=75743 RepID=UPI003B5C4460